MRHQIGAASHLLCFELRNESHRCTDVASAAGADGELPAHAGLWTSNPACCALDLIYKMKTQSGQMC